MSKQTVAEKKPESEFDTNPVLKKFKGCPELDSVTIIDRVVATSGDLRNLRGIARARDSRIFVRTIAGMPVVSHVDPNDVKGMPMNIPMTNVAGFVTAEDRIEREAMLKRIEDERAEAVRKAEQEQREAMLAQDARNRGEHEKVDEGGA